MALSIHQVTAHCAPLARVVDTAFSWNGEKPPRTPWHETVIYEVHVKGFTMRHPGVPPPLRGTYAGLSQEVAIGQLEEDELFYLQSRGITTKAAQRLVVIGFLNEVIQRLDQPSIATYLQRLIDEKFAA